MSYTVIQKNVKSSDGIHTLAGKIYVPNGKVKGIFHIVHGMTEHIDRYDHVMSEIADCGFVCFGYDNLGHGKTARDDSELGFIAKKDGYKYLVDDVYNFYKAVKKDYPDSEYILMGHSMGSFIVRLAAEKYGDKLSRLIICGTGGHQAAAPLGLLLCDILKATRGEKYISNMINNMAFGSYNKCFEQKTKYDWLTKDSSVIQKYAGDKYCTFSFTVSAMHDLVMLNRLSNRSDRFKNMRKDLPVLMISGDMDPVGNYGKGVTLVYNSLKKAGIKDISLKLYKDCRHEILNDTCRNEVIKDILEFIN